MFQSFASLLKKVQGQAPPVAVPVDEAEETEPIYKELAMTDELREAIFPRVPQMVSAIFDRPGVSHHVPLRPPPERPRQADSSRGHFPLI